MSPPIKLTKQQAFDKICKHLKKQRKCAMREFGNCRYRGDDGTMCAVGCLIPDELYSPSMEGFSSEAYPVCKLFPGALFDLLRACQHVHDNQSEKAKPRFAPGLKKVAKDFGLVWKHG